MVRFFKRLFHKKPKKLEQCETCGKWIDEKHIVVITDHFDDDRALAGGSTLAHSSISATFCRAHDPRKVK